jgi:transcriptional regulator with XRE-family HTH domain
MTEEQLRPFPWRTFLPNLEHLISEAGSAETFASAVGISFWTLREWRAERRTPTLASVQAIADEYDILIDDLLRDKLSARQSR